MVDVKLIMLLWNGSWICPDECRRKFYAAWNAHMRRVPPKGLKIQKGKPYPKLLDKRVDPSEKKKSEKKDNKNEE